MIIEIKDLNVYYNDNHALEDINLKIEKNDFMAIIGANGSGKSTLLKAIAKLVDYKGTINIQKEEIISYVPQNVNLKRDYPITCLEVIMSSKLNHKLNLFRKFSASDKEEARKYLKKVELLEKEKATFNDLSGGEKQRLLIARSLACKPTILLLDEPTSSVDAKSKRIIYGLLKELNDNMTIVLVTHDMMAVSSFVKNICCLNHTLVYHGKPKLTNEIVNNMYECPIDLVAHGVAHRVLGEEEQ